MRTVIIKTLVIAVTVAAAAQAHLEPGSMTSPQAGMSYPAGSQMTITWGQAEYHAGRYTLWYSRNGGTSWENIATWTGPTGDEVKVNYSWTVPEAPGTATKVRVCQISNCAEEDYVLISGAFTIAPASSVRPQAPIQGIGLTLHPSQGNLSVSFSMERTGQVVLEAVDASGSRKAILLEGRFAAGPHSLQVESPLFREGRPHFLVLRVDGHPIAETTLP